MLASNRAPWTTPAVFIIAETHHARGGSSPLSTEDSTYVIASG